MNHTNLTRTHTHARVHVTPHTTLGPPTPVQLRPAGPPAKPWGRADAICKAEMTSLGSLDQPSPGTVAVCQGRSVSGQWGERQGL